MRTGILLDYNITFDSLATRKSSFENHATISDSYSSNASLLEVMICSNNEYVFIRELSILSLFITFHAGWTCMNVGSKLQVGWNNSRHAPLWRFHLHCRIKETGIPAIICIVCDHVLRHPSEHGTSSMGKHLLVKAQIAKLNK